MDPIVALSVAAALLVGTLVVGFVWNARDGRRRTGRGEVVDAADAGGLGARATLVQFSTELCARCPQVRRMLGQVAGELEGVLHADVDLTHRTDLASKYRVLQTPTTFIVDGTGTVRARFNGVPRRADVEEALGALPALQEA
ncbi:thioredoxin family protein [Microbacterium sp. KUDC0406]|uniref:thioredoxin family protein n=1 Tax=Microbacterium sp. KUDC0406 TaxID=2909588 RepID=UPI001F2B5FFC|nr:thioredoxin family protein [Microbacterium sp. KUDC0406]UJP11303.1 thioredoxin family protein [Microbacterium sp. KUDC0406]